MGPNRFQKVCISPCQAQAHLESMNERTLRLWVPFLIKVSLYIVHWLTHLVVPEQGATSC